MNGILYYVIHPRNVSKKLEIGLLPTQTGTYMSFQTHLLLRYTFVPSLVVLYFCIFFFTVLESCQICFGQTVGGVRNCDQDLITANCHD